jgi:hypothetical protein
MCENAAECVTVSVTSASGPDGSDARVLKERVEPVYHPLNIPATARWSRSGMILRISN